MGRKIETRSNIVIGYKDKEKNRRILTRMKKAGLVKSFSQKKGYMVTMDNGKQGMLYYETVTYTKQEAKLRKGFLAKEKARKKKKKRR